MKFEAIRVQLHHCAKTFADGTQALLPSSLEIEPGEVLALLGPSGCGKTTLLRVMAGLESADPGGQVLFGADDVTSLPIERRNVGMVFQHYALFPHMTVAANIGYGLRVRGVDAAHAKRQVAELVDLVRLHGLEHKRPADLSGGQRQRVALARAIAVRPRLLLLDEPLTALDAQLKLSLRDELADLLRRLRITAVHVTHDQQEALAIADRLAVMQAGRIVQIGRGEDLYRQPGHSFVAQFLGRVSRLERSPQALEWGVLELGGVQIPCPQALAGASHVLVRPEDVQLGPVQSGWGQAVIQQRRFMGDHVQLKVQVVAQAELQVNVGRDSNLSVGDTVGIWIDPQHLQATQEEM